MQHRWNTFSLSNVATNLNLVFQKEVAKRDLFLPSVSPCDLSSGADNRCVFFLLARYQYFRQQVFGCLSSVPWLNWPLILSFILTYSLFKLLVWQCVSVFYEKLLELLTFPLESSYYPVFQNCCNCTAVIILTLNSDCRIWKGWRVGILINHSGSPRHTVSYQIYYELLRWRGLWTKCIDKLLRHKMPFSSRRMRKW